jgi:predicted RNase H-like HicB family nuclease
MVKIYTRGILISEAIMKADNDEPQQNVVFEKLSRKDGGGWLVRYLESPGCYGYGSTRKKALKSGEEALKLWMQACIDRGIPIPRTHPRRPPDKTSQNVIIPFLRPKEP